MALQALLSLATFLACYRLLGRLMREEDALDRVVTHFGTVPMRMRDLLQGCLIIGGTGSGKTTCAARILIDLLRVPTTGAALLAVKRDEPEHLGKCIRLANRQADVIRIGREHIAECRINALWLAYEPNRSVEAAVHLLDCLIEVAEGGSRGGGDGKDKFFRRSALNVCRFVLNILCPLGEQYVNFNNLGDVAKDAPHGAAYKGALAALTAGWAKLSPEQAKDANRARCYFEGPWADLANETKSGILANISVLVESFGSYPLRELLTTSGPLRPEWAWERGKVFLFCDSIQRYGQDARILQCAWKFLLQGALVRRDTRANDHWFLTWQDEGAQLILREYDEQFQSTARSYLCANVILLQNLNQIYHALGDKDAAASYVSNLRQRVVMQGDAASVKDICGWFGEGLRVVPGGGESKGFDPTDIWASDSPQSGARFEYAPLVKPEDISSLRPGGPHGWAGAIVYRAGTPFRSGCNFAFVKLKQLFL